MLPEFGEFPTQHWWIAQWFEGVGQARLWTRGGCQDTHVPDNHEAAELIP
ncbi:MAG: hypothetical protein ABI206_04445 [Antricoccus sp.]